MIRNLLLASAFLFTVNTFASSIRGTCGEDAFWTLENGTMTISGYGPTTNFEHPGNMYSTVFPEWDEYKDEIKKVIVEEGITSLGDFAFYKCFNLETAILPAGLTRIGNWTFYDCISLKSVDLPLSLEQLGDNQNNYSYMGYCFYNCQSLESITIPSNVKQMGGGVFNDCYALRTVFWNAVACNSFYNDAVARFLGNFTGSGVQEVFFGPEVKVVPPYLFYDHFSLTSIHTQGSIEYVGYNAFHNTMWEGFQETEKVIYIDKAAYMYRVNGQLIDPLYITFRDGTTGITDYIFDDENRLMSVNIPSTVSRIGIHSFLNCSNLSKVTWNPVAVEYMRESPQGYNSNPLFSEALAEISFGE